MSDPGIQEIWPFLGEKLSFEGFTRSQEYLGVLQVGDPAELVGFYGNIQTSNMTWMI